MQKNNQTTKPKSSIMADLLKKSEKKVVPLQKNADVEAKIVALSKNSAWFDVGGKALAVLGDKETKELGAYLPYLKAGETIKVRIISPESREGYPVVSLSRFFDGGKWKILLDKKSSEEPIDVSCGEYGKGGLFVDFMGVRGVIPKIQLLPEFMDSPEKLTGQRIKVKVLEVDEQKNRLVVSQKAVMSKFSNKDLAKQFAEIEVGKTYDAHVLGTSEFGIFCEVNGVEGLVHISEISWEKVTNASSFVRSGETIKVYVVEKNEADMKLNLSLKRLSHDPWSEIEEKYPKDKLLEGEVVRQERYGYFVRLAPGVEGLIHISKLKGSETFEVGQKVQVYVERISVPERRMSLVLPDTQKPLLYR
ncbi:MAG: S1 RNA-binding domain-containing protein [Patescibacteria group bacterium]